MCGDESGPRPTFALQPQNPGRAGRAIGPLARSGGTLVGAIVDGAVRTWLVDANGQLQLLILPAGFEARFDPLEPLNEHGDVVARGGDVVTVGGAHLVKASDPRRLGHKDVFSAWELTRRAPRHD